MRTLRMAIQVMRQVRMAVARGTSSRRGSKKAIVTINRDIVDSKRQFELG